MDRMIRRAARIKWRDILEMAQDHMTSHELERYHATIGKSEQSTHDWIDATLESGAVKWLIDLSDGDGKTLLLVLIIFKLDG